MNQERNHKTYNQHTETPQEEVRTLLIQFPILDFQSQLYSLLI